MGKPCITGVEDATLDFEAGTFTIGNTEVQRGDVVTIDGTAGNAYVGELPLESGTASADLDTLLEWADDAAKLAVWANADTPTMIEQARDFGARGIGLLRTERMFNEPASLEAIRRFILTESESDRDLALSALHDIQRSDFSALFKALNGLPLIVRLLDMPLHEFLPEELGRGHPEIEARRVEMAEVNPMMGHRGVRLGISHPELYRMQVDAIQDALSETPADVRLMIPQVMSQREAINVMEHINHAGLQVGVMIETVRACTRAEALAEHTDFFSFGTNDLTQAVFSFSREDAEKKFLNTYLDEGVLVHNPFTILDEHGVARVMEMAISLARARKPGFSIGVCGEHGGNPESIHIAHQLDVTYVSCSPYRIPVARLAAAHAALAT
jgi:pyruvate,orthophosphate dikinase